MGEAPEAERLDVIHHIPLLMLWHSYLRQDISACFPEAFATHRCPFRSTVKALPETLPEPWSLVQGPRSKHIVPWSTDLEPRIVDLGSGMLGLVSGYGSNWLEGWGVCSGCLRLGSRAVINRRWHRLGILFGLDDCSDILSAAAILSDCWI